MDHLNCLTRCPGDLLFYYLQKEHVPALLGLARAIMATDHSSSKPRNILKRIAKLPYKEIYHDEFEQSYIILAEMYSTKEKYDLAHELSRRCLVLNKSCPEAWDSIGLIMEKKQSFSEAAACFEKSWTLSNGENVVSGYKTALNYFKSKNTILALEIICQEVMSKMKENELMFRHCVKCIRP